ncbi:MAG: DUF397 domain-containing protein [Pseudonocardia sp.]
MSEPDNVETDGFRRSSFSTHGSNCVEVNLDPGAGVAIRHSKDVGRSIGFTCGEWAAFVAGVKSGEFDPV